MTFSLSASRVKMYLRCPAQFYFRYVQNLIMPSMSFLAQGQTMHQALEVNYVQKIQSNQDLGDEEIKDITADAFEENFIDIDLKIEGLENKRGEIKDQTIQITKSYHKEFSKDINPIAVEENFEFTLQDRNYAITGVIDVVDSNNVVIDHKTTKTKQTSYGDILQGLIYCLAKDCTVNRFNYVTKQKTPQTFSVETKATDNQLAHAIFMFDKVYKSAIELEIFYPNRSNNMCSRKYCGYWNECEKKFGGRVKD